MGECVHAITPCKYWFPAINSFFFRHPFGFFPVLFQFLGGNASHFLGVPLLSFPNGLFFVLFFLENRYESGK